MPEPQSPAPPPAVHLRAAVALLGEFPALAGLDLDVAAGEVVVLRGANGAGKTTLLRACAGLVPVTDGTALVLGVDLRADPRVVRTRVGLLGHGAGLYDELTVAENVRFWGRASGAPADRVDGALDRFGLAGRLADVAASRLSAGQRRRAALAALVVRRPELWLLDEPHAALDAPGRRLVDDLVREAAEAGAAVLLATHELERAHDLDARVVTLGGGVVVADEPAGGRAADPGDPGDREAQRVP